MRKPRASGKPEAAASPPSAVRKQCDIHAWAGGLDPRGHGWRCFSRLLTMYRTAVAKIVAFVLGTPTFFFWLSLAPSSMSPHHEDENELAWAQERNRASPWCPIKGYGGGRGLPGQGMTRLEVWRLRGHTGPVGSWGVPLFSRLLASSLCLPQDGDCKGTHVKPELKGYRVRFHIPSYSALARFPIQLIPGRRRGGP